VAYTKSAEVKKDSRVRLLDLVVCLSDAMDFIDPAVVNHHKQVALIAYCIGRQMGLTNAEQKQLVLAAALHDIGAFTLKERKDNLSFEMLAPHLHAERGYALLSLFKPIADVAGIVRFHHLSWDNGSGAEQAGKKVPAASHILNLADRVSVLINKKQEVLSQVPAVCRKIREESGRMFRPDAVDAFLTLASREYFWLDTLSSSPQSIFFHKLRSASIGLTSADMMGFCRLFSRIIDFKSQFTATHSSGVAASAEMLAKRIGFSERDCRLMKIAGLLHDLGKLAVPVEILNKPSGLAAKEWHMIRHHSFYTYRLLEKIPALGVVKKWAAFHHERLDGSGYPFHLTAKDLPLGSQVMSVADVFTAITENRPYRAGMTRRNAIRVMDDMVRSSALNGNLVAVLKAGYDGIDSARMHAQAMAEGEYRRLSMPGPVA
jgi:HD-GYP domain-containing protein (c-di-GMP phosphodiesterase class II)